MKEKTIVTLWCICFVIGIMAGSGTISDAVVTVSESINKESAEKVLVIDAGHGGFDGGASGADGTLEKNLNLEIAKKLKAIAEDYGVQVILTREIDEAVAGTKGEDLRQRRKIIEEAGADLTVSIHMNSFPSDKSVYGAQVFYPSELEESKAIAEEVQRSLELEIDDGRERSIMEKNDVLLLRNPAGEIILVECGFLSNDKELIRLKTPEYQSKLAEAIWKGINKRWELKKEQN